jgi:hypothetical protein
VNTERDEPGVGARLALERLKAGLEASLSPAPSASLGLVRSDAEQPTVRNLQPLVDGEDAWLRSSFDEADELLRDAVGWALAHLPTVAGDARATEQLALATARLVQMVGLTGLSLDDDALVQRALAWWGDLPLPEDDVPPDVIDDVRRLASRRAACTGEVRWRVAGPLEPGTALALGGRKVELTDEGSVRLPCGTWSARRYDAAGTPSAWEWRLEVSADAPLAVVVAPRFEKALRLQSERSIEIRAYAGWLDDLTAVAADRPFRALEVGMGRNGDAVVRDALEPNVPVPGGAVIQASASPREAQRSIRWVPWALYGLSAAALATAITLNAVTNDWIREQNSGEGARFDRIRQGKAGAWSAYGLAGASAMAGALWHVATW